MVFAGAKAAEKVAGTTLSRDLGYLTQHREGKGDRSLRWHDPVTCPQAGALNDSVGPRSGRRFCTPWLRPRASSPSSQQRIEQTRALDSHARSSSVSYGASARIS